MRSSTSASRPSSWSGRSALSFIPQITSVGTRTFGKCAEQPVGQGHRQAGRRHHHLRRAIPVEHRVERARLRPFRDILLLLGLGDLRQVDVAAEGPIEEPVEAILFDQLLESRRAEGGDILRSGALVLVLDQALLEDDRVGRVDDRQPGQAGIAAQRRAPRDRAAPVMADQARNVSIASASASAKMSSTSRSVL